jgi:FixJ family two-component response regulator
MQVADKCIAVVDDDASVRSATVDLLASVGFACKAFEGAEERLLADQGRAVPIIFITSYPDERVRGRAIRNGAICYLSKPYSEEELLDCIRLALDASGSRDP